MLARCSQGFGSVAALGMMAFESATASGPPLPHVRAQVKSVVFLYMDGGVSQVDSFDPKPLLAKYHGRDPGEAIGKLDPTQFNNFGPITKSPWEFHRCGNNGIPVSDLFPHIGTCVDDIAIIRSMVGQFPEHTNANYFLHTGHGLQGRPSIGAWVSYGLGSMNENLPGFVVLNGLLIPPGGLDNFHNGFLPSNYQASVFDSVDASLANIHRSEESDALQRGKLDFVKHMDHALRAVRGKNNAIESAVKNYELVYQMQAAVPELLDISSERKETCRLYGLESQDEYMQKYGRQCLIARRLVERGVRFIELTCTIPRIDRWDQHVKLKQRHAMNAHAVDQPIAGLIKDLKRRGLLESTLLVFTGEFGRTPFAQGTGRDHNPQGFSAWLAGGGVKGGVIHGATDEFGYRAVEKKTTIHDLHATILHQLGIDHERLTYRFSGRDIRLTDVYGNVVHDILV